MVNSLPGEKNSLELDEKLFDTIREAPMPEIDHWANLCWALDTASIARDRGLPWLPCGRRAELSGFFARPHIRKQLAPLLWQHAEQQKAALLGVYFENLWEFAFTHHPDYRLLQRNLPLRAAGRTLGELDFIVQHLSSDTVEHWEIAVKFYLQVTDEYWIGPGLRDRLDIKLARMRDHQLPLIHCPTVRDLLQRQNIRIDRQWALMPGRLFRPLGKEEAPLRADLNPDACRYWWAPLGEFQHRFAGKNLRWVRLPKYAWLAPLDRKVTESDSCEALADKLRSDGLRSPVCIAALSETGETSRGFVVPDGWYEAALKQLR